MVIELMSSNFKDIALKQGTTVLVDFWASWCGPCRIQKPIIEALGHEYKDKGVVIASVNVDESEDIAREYGVLSIPTLMIFKDGDIKERVAGLQNKESLVKKIEEYRIN